MPEETNETRNQEQNQNATSNKAWPWILAAGMVGSSLIMCLCGRGCTKGTGCGGDCGKTKHDTVWVVKEDPSIKVDGDAIIINGDNNDATPIKGNNNNSANRCSGNNNQNRGTVKPKPEPKPVVKPKPAPVIEPKPAPKQEPECKTVTTTTYEHFCISGDANDVVNAAIRIVNSNQR